MVYGSFVVLFWYKLTFWIYYVLWFIWLYFHSYIFKSKCSIAETNDNEQKMISLQYSSARTEPCKNRVRHFSKCAPVQLTKAHVKATFQLKLSCTFSFNLSENVWFLSMKITSALTAITLTSMGFLLFSLELTREVCEE